MEEQNNKRLPKIDVVYKEIKKKHEVIDHSIWREHKKYKNEFFIEIVERKKQGHISLTYFVKFKENSEEIEDVNFFLN